MVKCQTLLYILNLKSNSLLPIHRHGYRIAVKFTKIAHWENLYITFHGHFDIKFSTNHGLLLNSLRCNFDVIIGLWMLLMHQHRYLTAVLTKSSNRIKLQSVNTLNLHVYYHTTIKHYF